MSDRMDKTLLVFGWLVMVLPLLVLAALYDGGLPLIEKIIMIIILVSASTGGLEIVRREIDKL